MPATRNATINQQSRLKSANGFCGELQDSLNYTGTESRSRIHCTNATDGHDKNTEWKTFATDEIIMWGEASSWIIHVAIGVVDGKWVFGVRSSLLCDGVWVNRHETKTEVEEKDGEKEIKQNHTRRVEDKQRKDDDDERNDGRQTKQQPKPWPQINQWVAAVALTQRRLPLCVFAIYSRSCSVFRSFHLFIVFELRRNSMHCTQWFRVHALIVLRQTPDAHVHQKSTEVINQMPQKIWRMREMDFHC